MKNVFIKKIEWALVFVLIMSLIGCSGGEKQMFNEEELKTSSIQLAVGMAEGNFENVVKEFTTETAKQLNQQSLEKAWEQTSGELGNYKTVNSSTFIQKGDKASVEIVLLYEKNGLKVTFMYDKNNKIEGLWLNYASPEQPLTETMLYKEEAIKIGEDEMQVDGRLTLPKNVKNPPVVILVQGSGQTDMDETIGAQGNKPFQDIAYGLAEKGIASIRYNKRYYQHPELATEFITIQDEVLNDVDFAIALAKQDKRLDSDSIYILGHSLGGMLAPEIAYRNQNVSGIIVLAGTPKKLEDVILQQNKDAVNAMTDKTEQEKDTLLEPVVKEIEKIKLATLETQHTMIMGVNSEYWASLNQINTPEILKGITIPMIFLQGEEDFQVRVKGDFQLWKQLLAGRENVEFKSYKGLNHLFMASNGLKNIQEYNVKSKVDAIVIEDISIWIKEN